MSSEPLPPDRTPVGAPGRLARVLRSYQQALDEFDEAIAHLLGLNRTDLRCIDLLALHEPMAAGELARAAGLTSGAMTFVIDRLERAGYVQRTRSTDDRRKVELALVPAARERGFALHLPLVLEMREELAAFSDDELDAVERFLALGARLYRRHAATLRDVADEEGPPE